MICATCGGLVTWRGPIYDLTHTECESCGARNNQLPEAPNGEDELDGDEAVGSYYGL